MILHMIKTQSVQSDPKQRPIVESCILTCTRMNSRRPAVEFVNSSPGWFHASVCLGATRENLYWQSAVLTWAPPSQIGCMSDEYGSSVPVWASFWEFVLMNRATKLHTWFHQWICWVFLNWLSWIWMIYEATAVKFFLHSRIVKWPTSKLSFLSGGIKQWCLWWSPHL